MSASRGRKASQEMVEETSIDSSAPPDGTANLSWNARGTSIQVIDLAKQNRDIEVGSHTALLLLG